MSHQEILKERLIKMLRDRQYRRQKEEEEKLEEVIEVIIGLDI